MKIKTILLFFIVFLVLPHSPLAMPEELDSEKGQICVVLITGIGCSTCDKIEPLILVELTSQIPELVVLQYEIYKSHKSNQPVFEQYSNSYLFSREPRAIPFLILNRGLYFRGEMEIRNGIQAIRETSENMCPLPDGNLAPWMLLNLDTLPGEVKIFTKNRVFISKPGINEKTIPDTAEICIKELVSTKDVDSVLQNMDFKETEPEPVYISGGKISFQKAVKVGKWKLQWNE